MGLECIPFPNISINFNRDIGMIKSAKTLQYGEITDVCSLSVSCTISSCCCFNPAVLNQISLIFMIIQLTFGTYHV